ncbi:isopenicillin N synthase family dioxygenase [Mucilaginibacter xinganensis]|uniref:2-oxoglutarate-dependent ethylene/succinate-forming enzyme n=1 Tax=Mucilaginibacter xinganensis TaxID=1234841 RepID=A0A223NZZ6_9SPHI|nr:2-oxoglutarate and iron-dependent oxygenase domain-containing protein [Mucilaginibacter xinganensis]ASU35432.1 Isopenicillin N synthase [Mucilaginibacter xinganensis]
MINIPRLDLNLYTEGTSGERKQFSDEIGKAFNETGFVTITNHGLDKQLIDKLYEDITALFALPDEVKLKYEIPGLAGQRGYTGKQKETAKGFTAPDLKEFWQIGQTVTDDESLKAEYPDNLTVGELPSFNETTLQVYKKLEWIGQHLLQAIAVYLNLPESYFDGKVHNGNSILRTLHYFPITNPDALPDDAVRAGAHEDINLITLLIGASADGLEVLTRDNDWFPVKAHGEDLVVNVGDMLQRLTNNQLKSTTHRVVNPPRELMKNSRYSVPFFLHPKADMSLACLPQCIDATHPKQYEDITAGAYLDERLREIGLKK